MKDFLWNIFAFFIAIIALIGGAWLVFTVGSTFLNLHWSDILLVLFAGFFIMYVFVEVLSIGKIIAIFGGLLIGAKILGIILSSLATHSEILAVVLVTCYIYSKITESPTPPHMRKKWQEYIEKALNEISLAREEKNEIIYSAKSKIWSKSMTESQRTMVFWAAVVSANRSLNITEDYMTSWIDKFRIRNGN